MIRNWQRMFWKYFMLSTDIPVVNKYYYDALSIYLKTNKCCLKIENKVGSVEPSSSLTILQLGFAKRSFRQMFL